MDKRYRQLKRVSALLMALNLCLATVKLVTGCIFTSVAVLSDGLDSSIDVLMAGMMLLGIFLARGPADDDHPYGHQRIESVTAALCALAIGASAVMICYEATRKLFFGSQLEISVFTFAVTVVSIFGKEFMSRLSRRYAKCLDSASMMAVSHNYRADALTSGAVLVGLIGAAFGVMWLEPLAAIGVSVLIGRTAIGILRGSFAELVDKSAPPETVEVLRKTALAVDGVLGVDVIRTRKSGTVLFADIEIAVDAALTVGEAHTIAERVHTAVEHADLRVEHCMVHVNPCAAPFDADGD